MSKSWFSRRSRRRSVLLTLYRKFWVIVQILRRIGEPNTKAVDPSNITSTGLDHDASDTASDDGSTSGCKTGCVRINEPRHVPELENAALPADDDNLQDVIADLLQCVTEMQQSNVEIRQSLADIKKSFPNHCADGLLDAIRQDVEGQLDSSDGQVSSGCVPVGEGNTNVDDCERVHKEGTTERRGRKRKHSCKYDRLVEPIIRLDPCDVGSTRGRGAQAKNPNRYRSG